MALRPFTPISPDDPRGAARVVRVNLLTPAAAGVLAAIPNPFGEAAVVLECVLNVTTPATGAATADVGVAATAVTNDTLMDGVDIGSAAIMTTNMLEFVGDYATANGNAAGVVPLAATGYITAFGSADATGLVGTLQALVMKVSPVV
jgi:hypothetical protein